MRNLGTGLVIARNAAESVLGTDKTFTIGIIAARGTVMLCGITAIFGRSTRIVTSCFIGTVGAIRVSIADKGLLDTESASAFEFIVCAIGPAEFGGFICSIGAILEPVTSVGAWYTGSVETIDLLAVTSAGSSAVSVVAVQVRTVKIGLTDPVAQKTFRRTVSKAINDISSWTVRVIASGVAQVGFSGAEAEVISYLNTCSQICLALFFATQAVHFISPIGTVRCSVAK